MRLGYLYSRCPVISQTFCDTEMPVLEKLGFSLEVGSIYPLLSSLRHAHAARLRAPIRYAPPQQVLRVWEKNAKLSGKWPASRRNISILPIVCEFDSETGLNSEQEAIAPTLEFLPDALVIEAERLSNHATAQRLEDDHTCAEERVPVALFLREARFTLSLRKMLAEKNFSHVHATSSPALVCAMLLQHLVDLTISATIEPRPPVSPEWIKVALRQCRGGRLSDRKLIRRRGSSFLFDKAASRKNPLHLFAEKLGIDLTGHGSFWQKWSELLVR